MEKPKIVLPEGDDERVRLAARVLLETKPIAHPILIGNTAEIVAELGKSSDYSVLSPDDSDSPLVQGAEMVSRGTAAGIVAGAAHSTADVLRTYIKTIGIQPGVSRVTSCFLMEKEGLEYIFADCAVNISPTPETLAETAYLSYEFAKILSIEPKVVMLSFSTKGSATHEVVDNVVKATQIAKERYPEMLIDGELQFDTAINKNIALKKDPEGVINGEANIFIFPDLNAGNIAYKIAERLGGFKATGPLLLGFSKPAHDLSRGCSVDDIVSAVEIAVLQAKTAKTVSRETI